MDPLFHFILSLAGGFVFLGLLDFRYRPLDLFLLSFLSLFIDFQHILEAFHIPIVFHAFYFALLPLLPAAYFYSRSQTLSVYSVAFSLMLFGHLFSDMVQGMYGVPLLYPFSGHLFMLPRGLLFFGSNPVIGSAGLAMALYFGLIFLVSRAFSHFRLRK